jgi:nucleoside-diphosphate-sugar epimerase
VTGNRVAGASQYASYSSVRVVVLGASGFIGRWVARSLCGRDADVCLVVHHRAAAEPIFSRYSIRGDILELDLRESRTVQDLYRKIKPSITFNLAGYGVDRTERDEKTAYQINAHLVKVLCQIVTETRDAEWMGQDLVHVGSALEYGEIGGNLSEDSTPNPTSLYGKSKLAGTRYLTSCCQAQGIRGLTARLFTVYGPGEHQGRLLPSLLETAKSGQPLRLTAGTQKRDFTYIEDVAEGLLRLGLSTTQPGEAVNMATGQLTSVRSFTETAARILGIPDDRLEFGSLPTRAEEMDHAPVSVERLQRITGWVPSTSIAEGIRNTQVLVSQTGDRLG